MDSKKFIEIKKPVEEVREVKEENQIPSFEEFMKVYQTDENVNYADLENGGIGDSKGYGPGNNTSSEEGKETVKKVTGVAGGLGIAALSIVCPPAGAAAVAGTVLSVGTAKTVSALAPEDSTTKEIADFAGDIYTTSATIGSCPTAAKKVQKEVNKK